jgi:hypothetical protein
MGMFNLHHLEVHLRCTLIREQTGLRPQACVVSEEAAFLSELPAQFAGLYSVVPQARVQELLEVDDDRYRAVLSGRASRIERIRSGARCAIRSTLHSDRRRRRGS